MSEPNSPNPFEAPAAEEVARLFPAYDVHSLIACGGMGAVYHATQRSLDRSVAIKILPREFSHDEAFRTGFEAEAKAMAKLNHPNLIGVYDFGEVDGMLYIVMEYVEGQSLHQAVHGRAMEQADALKVIIDICRGLAHAHEHGILHRDIKPGNILLDANGNPKIGDFGLARALEKEIEEEEQIYGTPGYTAPEVTSPPFTFDHRADVYSVGAMLQELLTGKPPETAQEPASALIVPNPRINAIIRKATRPDPGSRYSSASELAESIEKIAASPGRNLVTNPSTASGAFARRAPAKKSSSGLTVLLLLLAIAAAAAFYVFKVRKDEVAKPSAEEDEPAQEQVVVVPVEPEDPEPEQVIVVPPPPEDPEPEQVTEPKYDTEAFFDKARDLMKAEVSAETEVFKTELEKNTKLYVRDLVGLIRGWSADRLESAEANLRSEYGKWQENHYLMPGEVPEEFEKSSEAGEIHSKYFAVQTTLREKFSEIIGEHSETYITGIEYQIKRLDEAEDQEAIDVLEEEITRVKEEPAYFESLILD